MFLKLVQFSALDARIGQFAQNAQEIDSIGGCGFRIGHPKRVSEPISKAHFCVPPRVQMREPWNYGGLARQRMPVFHGDICPKNMTAKHGKHDKSSLWRIENRTRNFQLPLAF
jgi:hypothetical protein